MWKCSISSMVIGAIALAPITGCESLPGNEKEQGAVIGGVGGAAAGAALAKDNRVIGALIGGALGAGGGYLVGANMEKNKDRDKDEVRRDAKAAAEKAQSDPANAADVKKSDDADLNRDSFVTLDEIVAMEEADIGNPEMIRRLRRTGQSFDLTEEQQNYLREHGVDQKVITAMKDMETSEVDLDAARNASDTEVEMRTDPGRRSN